MRVRIVDTEVAMELVMGSSFNTATGVECSVGELRGALDEDENEVEEVVVLVLGLLAVTCIGRSGLLVIFKVVG